MAYVPKIFKDRAVEFPFRRLLTPVSGQANTVDVSRVPGTIFAVGDEPDAANLNAEFGKIKTETDSINTSLNALSTNTNSYTLLATHSTQTSTQKTITTLANFKEVQIELVDGAGQIYATSQIPVGRFRLQNSASKQLFAMQGTSIAAQSYYASDTSVYMIATTGYIANLYGIK